MTQNRKATIFILSGLAVWAYYKYLKLSDEGKHDLHMKLKETGKKFIAPFIPDEVKDMLAKKDSIDNDQHYGTSSF